MAIELRQTGISVVGDVPWGTHFCHFYETKEDLLDTLVPYFKVGLESKEFCLWVLADPLTKGEARRALNQAVPDLDEHFLNENIEILDGPEWYLNENVFNIERVTNAWDAKLKRALALGFDGMRVSGDTCWLVEKDWKDFCSYEKQVNDSITNRPMTVLCTYPLARSGATEILDVVQAHQFATARRQGEWEVIETPKLIQAKAEVKRLNEDLEQRVFARTSELLMANEELRKEIAERRRAEALLHAKEQEFRAIVENAPDQIIRYDREFRRTYVNPAVARAYGLPAESLVGKPIGSLIQDAGLDVKDELAQMRQQIAAVFETGQSCEYETTWPLPTGRKFYSVRLFPELDLSGSVIHVLGIARDITERRQAEEALDERLRFETLVTELSAAFANLTTTEVDREIDKWLQTLAEFLCVDRASFLQFGEDWTTLYRSHSYTVPGIEPLPPPIALKDQFPWITDQLRRGVTVKWSRIPDDMPEQAAKEREYAAKLGVKSGLNIPVRIGGSVIGAIAFTSIVTYRDWPDAMVARLRLVGEIFAAAIERKHAEEALRQAERKYRDIFEGAGEGIFQSTPDGRFIAANPALARMHGFASPEELIDSRQDISRQIYVDPTRREEFKRQLEEHGALRGFEHQVFRKDGSRLWISVNAHAVRDEQGAIQYYEGTAQDINERKAAEEKLKATSEQLRALSARLQSAREEEGTRIARELHDELGSALTRLRCDLEVMDKEQVQNNADGSNSRPKIEEMMKLIDGTINSIRRITAELRPNVLDDLGPVSAIRWQAQQFEAQAGIVCQCDLGVTEVDLNQQQSTTIFRVFQEALTNVRRHAQATRVDVTLDKENDELVLTIRDNGRGITVAEKSDRRSLGLLGMRERVSLIGGRIQITGVEGKGTVITVRVPISRKP